MKKKMLMLMTVLLLVLVAVTACGMPKITGVKSLVAANIAAQSKVKSYHMDGKVNMNIALDSDELKALLKSLDPKLPVKMTMAADAGRETAHVISESSVSLLGQSVSVQTSESYIDMDNGVAYMKNNGSSDWEKTEYMDQELNIKDVASGLALAGKTVLENAAFSESDEFYTLTMPADKAGDLITDMNLIDSMDLGIANIHDITVEGGRIVYNVDKETLLVSTVELKDIDVRGKGSYEDVSVDLMFPINADFRFSRYDELEESEYAIPGNVLEVKAQ